MVPVQSSNAARRSGRECGRGPAGSKALRSKDGTSFSAVVASAMAASFLLREASCLHHNVEAEPDRPGPERDQQEPGPERQAPRQSRQPVERAAGRLEQHGDDQRQRKRETEEGKRNESAREQSQQAEADRQENRVRQTERAH